VVGIRIIFSIAFFNFSDYQWQNIQHFKIYHWYMSNSVYGWRLCTCNGNLSSIFRLLDSSLFGGTFVFNDVVQLPITVDCIRVRGGYSRINGRYRGWYKMKWGDAN
jgi:hypothetical protein